jgi:hypothetical protein
MRYKALFLLLVMLAGLNIWRISPVLALQEEGERAVQILFDQTNPDTPFAYFDLYGMKAGQTIYVYVESDEFDTFAGVCDITCETLFAENDDIETGVNTNSALQYTFEADGDFSVVVSDYATVFEDGTPQQGNFRIIIGFNAPDVLDGTAASTNANLAIPWRPQVQEFFGETTPDQQIAYYDLFGMKAGQTIYLYSESDQFDTYLIVCDIACETIFAENDDIETGVNTNSSLQYTFEADGDYSIAVTDYGFLSDGEQESRQGIFRVLIGYYAEDVLKGTAISTNAEIAVPFVFRDGEPEIQEFYSQVSPENEFVYFDLFGMLAGETIYIYAESSEIDPLIVVCNLDCDEEFARNDDLEEGVNTNAGLEYTFAADGDYSIAITDCCRSDVTGIFRVQIGRNAPDILTGTAIANNAQIAVPYEPTFVDVSNLTPASGGGQVQLLSGTLDPDTPNVYFDIFGATAGQTLYLYAEAQGFTPAVILCDIACEQLFASTENTTSPTAALEYTFEADGDYSIAVTDCCSEEALGEFSLTLGYAAPEVLTGEAIPNGAEIAIPYEPVRQTVTVGEVAPASADCGALAERPELSGQMLTRETQNFIVHYTPDGVDGATDSFVDEVIKVLDDILSIQVDQLGWPLPLADCGEGGDTRFDLYLQEILGEGVLGYAVPDGLVGDNPGTQAVETWAGFSHLIIDNDFEGVTAPLPTMRATVAHEIHHAIQFAYDINDSDRWLYEATASWIETKTYPGDEAASPYVDALLNTADLCIGSTPDDPFYDTRVYGEWLLIDSIAQDFGDPSITRFWEIIADFDGIDSFYTLLQDLGTDPIDVMARYAVRNVILDYDLAPMFPSTVRVEGDINGVGDITPRQDGVAELGSDYYNVRVKGTYSFAVDQANLFLLVVGIDRALGEARVFPLGQGGTVDTTQFTHSYVIVLNTDPAPPPDTCTYTDYVLSVFDGSGQALNDPLDEVFDAQHFVPAG